MSPYKKMRCEAARLSPNYEVAREFIKAHRVGFSNILLQQVWPQEFRVPNGCPRRAFAEFWTAEDAVEWARETNLKGWNIEMMINPPLPRLSEALTSHARPRVVQHVIADYRHYPLGARYGSERNPLPHFKPEQGPLFSTKIETGLYTTVLWQLNRAHEVEWVPSAGHSCILTSDFTSPDWRFSTGRFGFHPRGLCEPIPLPGTIYCPPKYECDWFRVAPVVVEVSYLLNKKYALAELRRGPF